MNTKTVFTSKAEKYARYRWDYAPLAIQAIFKIARISTNSSGADIGAGTGILTRHFGSKVKQIFAIEPNKEMREEAKKVLFQSSPCVIIDGFAEATTLPESSVEIILVAQAIHWFDPTRTRKEFLRILKPQGWLAILRNYSINQELNKAIEEISIQDNGVDPSRFATMSENQPMSFYYGTAVFQRMTFPFRYQQN
jgi:ubiquinone/menaquinone biosynthesis C-methylase UbiE